MGGEKASFSTQLFCVSVCLLRLRCCVPTASSSTLHVLLAQEKSRCCCLTDSSGRNLKLQLPAVCCLGYLCRSPRSSIGDMINFWIFLDVVCVFLASTPIIHDEHCLGRIFDLSSTDDRCLSFLINNNNVSSFSCSRSKEPSSHSWTPPVLSSATSYTRTADDH